MDSILRSRCDVLMLLFLLVTSIQASSSLFDLIPRHLSSRSLPDTHGVPLRILPLGASITYGLHSSDGNGYRYALRGKLIAEGNDVNMLGVVTHGNMSNNEVSGFPGQRIDQVAAKQDLALDSKPNVVLIEVGTNDCIQNYSIADAHSRMGALIGRVVNASPNVTVLVGSLLPNADPNAEANILTFNAELPDMIAGFVAQGYKVSLVDFHNSLWSLADLRSDGTHPTDLGYVKMSAVWYDSILQAAKGGNITAPAAVAGVDDYAAGNDTVAAHTAINVVCTNKTMDSQLPGTCSGASKQAVLNSAFMAIILAAVYTLI